MALEDLSPEQRQLAEFMSRLSQRTYHAVWMLGIEQELWRAVLARSLHLIPLDLAVEEVQHLRAMSTQCGGWIVFDEGRGETFVPMAEWMSRTG